MNACGDAPSQREDASAESSTSLTASSPSAADTSATDPFSLRDEALTQLTREAFTFAYPLMEQYRMLLGLTNPQSPAFVAKLNELIADRVLKGPESTDVIRPNADTLYGGVFMDLRAEPMVIGVPDIGDSRYYSVQL